MYNNPNHVDGFPYRHHISYNTDTSLLRAFFLFPKIPNLISSSGLKYTEVAMNLWEVVFNDLKHFARVDSKKQEAQTWSLRNTKFLIGETTIYRDMLERVR